MIFLSTASGTTGPGGAGVGVGVGVGPPGSGLLDAGLLGSGLLDSMVRFPWCERAYAIGSMPAPAPVNAFRLRPLVTRRRDSNVMRTGSQTHPFRQTSSRRWISIL